MPDDGIMLGGMRNHLNLAPSPEAMTSPAEPKLGELLLKRGLLTSAQLHEALCLQRELTIYKPLGQILVDQKVMAAPQLNLVLDVYRKRCRLGEVLIKTGVIIRDQLTVALEQQQTTGLRLGETLLKLNYLTEEEMRRALSIQLNIPFVDLDKMTLPRSLATLINKGYARKHLVVPTARHETTITLAMDDPTAAAVIGELRSSTGNALEVVTATRGAIQRAFTRVYEEQMLQEPGGLTASAELFTRDELEELDPTGTTGTDYQTEKADELVRKLITYAITCRASDIHFETLRHSVRIRFRIDGVLQDPNLGVVGEAINKNNRAIVSRIKVLGKLDIAEKRRPQDGAFRVRMEKDGRLLNIDLRISIIPGYYGENVVLRILDARNAPRSVEHVGLSPAITEGLLQLLRKTTGLILITGPTGSGKSTTLYGALMTLYTPEIRILTAEDPIEYVYEYFSQCEVNDKIGNTFASYLRAFLRHDPEVIMLGEIRDAETASMTFRAAQTGHLVLSTLHTNDAVSALTRLLVLGVDATLITSSLLGVLSQRLVRELCADCKQACQPAETLMQEFFDEPPADITWYAAQGCPRCNFTGYRGRMAVAELWVPNDQDIILINKGAPFDEIQASAATSTLSMAADAMQKLRAGRTNLDELIRTLPYSSIRQFRRLRTSH